MNTFTQLNQSQVYRESPSQFLESQAHRNAINRSSSAQIVRSGNGPCEIVKLTLYPPDQRLSNGVYQKETQKISKEKVQQINRGNTMTNRGNIDGLSEKNMHKILKSDFYYTDFNEIRSINEFLYVKNNIAVNQHTKKIHTMREDLKKKQKQIQAIIKKEQDLDQDEHHLTDSITTQQLQKYLSGQKILLCENKSKKSNYPQSVRINQLGENKQIDQQISQDISSFNDSNMQKTESETKQMIIKKVNSASSIQNQNDRRSRENQGNQIILIQNSTTEQVKQANNIQGFEEGSPMTIIESAKEDSTRIGEQDSFSPLLAFQDEQRLINLQQANDSIKLNTITSQDGNQINLFQNYNDAVIEYLVKNQKLSTISERDSEVILQKDNYQQSYQSIVNSYDSQMQKVKVIDMNTMYELFLPHKQSSEAPNYMNHLNTQDNITQSKGSPQATRIRISSNVNEESAITDGSDLIYSHLIDDMNSKYNPNNKFGQPNNHQFQNVYENRINMVQNIIPTRSLSANLNGRSDKLTAVPQQGNQMNMIAPSRRKSSQQSIYLNTQQHSQINRIQDINLQNIAQMPVYKCTFKKKSKHPQSKNGGSQSPTSGKQMQSESQHYQQYTMKEADRFLLNYQIVNGFKQKQQPKQSQSNLPLYQSIKDAELFNHRIEEAISVKRIEYDKKYNQFSTAYNSQQQRQSRSSQEARVSSAIKKTNQNNIGSKTQQEFFQSPQKQRSEQQAKITITNYETNISNHQSNGDITNNMSVQPRMQQELEQQQQQKQQQISNQEELKNIINVYKMHQNYKEQEQINSDNIQPLQTNESTSKSEQKIVKQNNLFNNTVTSFNTANVKVNNIELFHTEQNIKETSQRIKDNLKKIDINLKKERNYLAKMNMIKTHLSQPQFQNGIPQRSQSLLNSNSPIKTAQHIPKSAKLTRAEVSRIFKTSEQIQMHKEIGLYNRITYNNFIQKDNKNKILLKNCNYVEFYQ